MNRSTGKETKREYFYFSGLFWEGDREEGWHCARLSLFIASCGSAQDGENESMVAILQIDSRHESNIYFQC